MPLIYTLFLIVFLEGYIVLSVELLAIRQLLPFVGSGTDTTAILIASVLVPLAFGYYTGGLYKIKNKRTIRKRLLRNLAGASLFLLVGLSYGFIHDLYLYARIKFHIGFLSFTALYGLFLIAPPVYLLGQTVPLISNYLPKQKFSHAAGKILFFSTLGSFAGAIFSSLVLMAYIGVHYTVSITIGCILMLAFIIAKKHPNLPVFVIAFAVLFSLFVNSGTALKAFGVIQNNQHNLVQVELYRSGLKVMKLNAAAWGGASSSLVYDEKTGLKRTTLPNLQYAEDRFINTDPSLPPRDILVLGAGGFAFGYYDRHNNYLFVDVDKDLQTTSEKYFLDEALPENKVFVPEPARAFLTATDKKFDLVFVDLFNGPSLIPDHLVTKEFFLQVKNVLKENGIMVMNSVMSADLRDEHAVVFDNTVRAAFKNVMRTELFPYDPWAEEASLQNVMYTYFNRAPDTERIYTDNLNRQVFDKRKREKMAR